MTRPSSQCFSIKARLLSASSFLVSEPDQIFSTAGRGEFSQRDRQSFYSTPTASKMALLMTAAVGPCWVAETFCTNGPSVHRTAKECCNGGIRAGGER